MIYAIVGHSASGKSTIERRLEAKGIDRIISYTTRPMRKEEVEDVDYHFVDEFHFEQMLKDGFFAEYAEYNNTFYGLSLDGVFYTEKDYIVVVTPKGYEELLESVGKEWVTAFFIHVPERDRLVRQLLRGDDVDEVMRRLNTDRDDFAGFIDEADITFNNKDLDKVVDYIYSIIKC